MTDGVSMRDVQIDAEVFEREYLRPVHRVGAITMIIVSSFIVVVPALWLYLQYGVFPQWSHLLAGFVLAMTYAGPFYFSEPIAYYPIVGDAGWYMTATTGNGSNLRVPCAAVAQEVAGVKEGTREGELVAAVGIGISVLVGVVSVLIGCVAIGWFTRFFPEWLVDAFKGYLLPAVFGACWGQFVLRGPRYAPAAVILALVPLLLNWPTYIVMPVGVIGTFLFGWWLYKRFGIEA